jgi:hypothetical protein
MKTGFNHDLSSTPSTAGTLYENNQSFSQAAQVAEKKLDEMFQAKLNFSDSKAQKTKGNSSLQLVKTQSCFQPLLNTFE